MKQLITINLTTKTSDWQPPVLTFGEALTLGLRFTKTIDGNLVEPNFVIDSARAMIGLVDARPGGGSFALGFGDSPDADHTTAAVPHDCAPAVLAAAINAKSALVAAYGTATAKKFNGSWLLRFGTGAAEVPFAVVDNTLWPVSFGRVSAWELDSTWVHELRLVQAPVAFVSGEADVVLPPLPSVTIKQHGGGSGSYTWDTIQELYIPADFRGAYRLKKGYQRTQLIAPDAGTDEIQAALIAAFGSTFTVTLPLSYHFLIDFGGTFAGTDVAALTVEGAEAPAGDLLLTLPLDRAELASLLRALPAVTLPLEIRIVAAEDGGDPLDIAVLNVPVTIQRSLDFAELESTPTIDWLRFPSPKTYRPLGTGDTLTGEKIYAITVGDASATSFVLTHPLASWDVTVAARLNTAGGRQLIDGTDFTATIDSTGQVTVAALTGAPALNAWRIMVTAAREITSWNPELTVTTAQVTGLDDDLTAIDARLTTLETLLPANASLPSTTAPSNGMTIQLLPSSGILFARDATGAPITDVAKLSARPPYLLPAIDRTSNDGALPTTPLPTPALNGLWTTAAATLIPGGGHIRSSNSCASGFVGSDGRMLYPVTRSGTTDSYFPTPFELVLFEMLINDLMFSSGTTLTLLAKLALQLIDANSEAQWVLAIEQGTLAADTDGPPNTYDQNLASVTWGVATPLVRQPLYLGSALQTHGFGATILNNAGTFTANGLLYQRVLSANSNVLQNANFALRARLLNFDTKNSAAGTARGWVSWALQAPDNGTLGVVIA